MKAYVVKLKLSLYSTNYHAMKTYVIKWSLYLSTTPWRRMW